MKLVQGFGVGGFACGVFVAGFGGLERVARDAAAAEAMAARFRVCHEAWLDRALASGLVERIPLRDGRTGESWWRLVLAGERGGGLGA